MITSTSIEDALQEPTASPQGTSAENSTKALIPNIGDKTMNYRTPSERTDNPLNPKALAAYIRNVEEDSGKEVASFELEEISTFVPCTEDKLPEIVNSQGKFYDEASLQQIPEDIKRNMNGLVVSCTRLNVTFK